MRYLALKMFDLSNSLLKNEMIRLNLSCGAILFRNSHRQGHTIQVFTSHAGRGNRRRKARRG